MMRQLLQVFWRDLRVFWKFILLVGYFFIIEIPFFQDINGERLAFEEDDLRVLVFLFATSLTVLDSPARSRDFRNTRPIRMTTLLTSKALILLGGVIGPWVAVHVFFLLHEAAINWSLGRVLVESATELLVGGCFGLAFGCLFRSEKILWIFSMPAFLAMFLSYAFAERLGRSFGWAFLEPQSPFAVLSSLGAGVSWIVLFLIVILFRSLYDKPLGGIALACLGVLVTSFGLGLVPWIPVIFPEVMQGTADQA